ncbi:MAG: prephenate dehydratase [Marivirga sp.]
MGNPYKRIAIQGFEGSFHHKAANAFYGENITLVPCNTFAEVFRQCAHDNNAESAVMALENSIAGTILPNYQLLKASNLTVAGEIYLKINQHLLALPGQEVNDITEVRSHHMAIKQCEEFLRQQPKITVIETEDTALSAKIIKEQALRGVAAIAGEQAAQLYGLSIIRNNIETVHNNYTRFLVLEKQHIPIEGANKASLLFSLQHQPSTLVTLLNIIAAYGFNITKIQSFPIIEEEWKYYFALDIEFSSSSKLDKAIELMAVKTDYLKILGIYKKGITV